MTAKWDVRFLSMARMVSEWSKDPRTKVGAVLVRPDKTVSSVGFNGLAPGMSDAHVCDRALKNLIVLHAEENAVHSARDPSLSGFSLYVWGLRPCGHCASVVARRGISSVTCVEAASSPSWAESNAAAELVFRETSVSLRSLALEEWETFAKGAEDSAAGDAT